MNRMRVSHRMARLMGYSYYDLERTLTRFLIDSCGRLRDDAHFTANAFDISEEEHLLLSMKEPKLASVIVHLDGWMLYD